MPERITTGHLYHRIAKANEGQAAPVSSPARDQAFGDLLAREIEARRIKFSGHAQTRLRSRGIELTTEGLTKLDEALAKAESKGGRESLVVLDGLAMVVSVANRTVITAVDNAESTDHVFTNIDSAVIMR
jgi:flagellar operon protein